MTGPDEPGDLPYATRIPTDISRPDRLLGPFTARQTALLTVVALVLYGGWWATRPILAPLAYVALVIPVAGTAAGLALGQREGLSLDRFLRAALAHARARGRRVHAPKGVSPFPAIVPGRWAKAAGPLPAPMHMPYEGVSSAGVLALKDGGTAALATCSTVNFELRSMAEQHSLTTGFARWLNSLTGPTQLLVRCHRIDLAPLADALQHDAAALPHPALEQAARAHADFLTDLATSGDLLGRQVVLVAREEATPRNQGQRAGAGRVLQRIDEAARALAGAEVAVGPLNPEQTADLITAACNPDTAPQAQRKGDLA
jgi:hypothetical protein